MHLHRTKDRDPAHSSKWETPMNEDPNGNSRRRYGSSGGSSLLLAALAIVVVLSTVYFAARDRQQSPLLSSGRDLAVPSPTIRDK